MSGVVWDADAIEGGLENLETYRLKHVVLMLGYERWDRLNAEIVTQVAALRALLALLPDIDAALAWAEAATGIPHGDCARRRA